MRSLRRFLSGILVTLLTVTSMVTTSVAAPGPVPTPFVDVFATEYADAVGPLYELGLVSGVSEHIFGVEQPVNRAQMAAFLVRATKVSGDSVGSAGYADVPATHWAATVVAQASAAGYVSGYQGNFRPDDTVTQAEAVTMLMRALGYPRNLDYPVGYVLKAREVGLLSDSTSFSISANATRGWVAQVLARAVFVVKLPGTDLTLSQKLFKVAVSVSIAPETEYLLPGTTDLTALGADRFGNRFAADATWTVNSGPATITDGGRINVTGPGVVKVTTRTTNGLEATTAYDALQSLAAKPAALSLQTGKSTDVVVEGVTGGGKHYAVKPQLQVVSGGLTLAGATVTGNTKGTGVVRATMGPLKVDIPVVVGGTLAISSPVSVAAPGQQVQMQVQVDGSSIDPAAVSWSVDGVGTISDSGVFTAAATSKAPVVKATVGELTASLPVNVISRLVIEGERTTLTQGMELKYSVVGITSDNQRLPLPTATCGRVGSAVVVTSDCRVAGITRGQGSVTATYGGLTASLPVSVVGAPSRLGMILDRYSVPANGRTPVTITLEAQDDQGLAVPQGSQTITLNVTQSNVGTLDKSQVTLENGKGTVIFTPSNQVGDVTILAAATDGGLLPAMASLNTTLPSPTQVRLTAGPSTLQAQGSGTSIITATLLDADGAAISYTSNSGGLVVNLSTSGSQIGTLSSNVLVIPVGIASVTTTFTTNGTVGSLTLTGSAALPVTSTTISTKVAGPAVKLKVQPPTTTVVANGTDVLEVPVEVQDANGITRTADSYGGLQGSLVCGTATYSSTAAIMNGVATFSLNSAVAGTCVFTASAPTFGSDKAEVTFKPGPATQLILSTSNSVVPADGVSTIDVIAKVADANGNVVLSPAYTVGFSRLVNNQATKPPSNLVMSTANGVAKITVTSTVRQADDTYTASVPGLNTVGVEGTDHILVSSRIVGTATHVVVQSVSNNSPTVGGSVTVKVAVADDNNYVRSNDNTQVVNLSATNGAVVTPGQQTVVNGVATFTVSSTKSGASTYTASAGALRAATGQLSFAPGTIAQVSLTADALRLAADGASQTQIRAQAIDQYGNSVTSNFTSTLSMSSNLGTLSTTTVYGPNPVTFTAGIRTGDVTITATANGSSFAVAPVTISLGTPGVPARLAVEAPKTLSAGITNMVRVRVIDSNGNVMGNLTSGNDLSQIGLQITGNSGVTTTISSSGSGSLTNYGYIADGVVRGAMPAFNGVATFNVTDTKADTLTLTPIGYYRGAALQGQSSIVSVGAGPAAGFALVPGKVVYNAATANSVTFTASVTDSHGNTVASANPDTFTLTLSNTSLLDAPVTSTHTTVNGVATITFKVKTGVAGLTSGTITSALTGQSSVVEIVGDSVPDPPSIFVTDNAGIDSGVGSWESAMVVITPTVRYVDQRIVVLVNGQIVPLYADLTFTTQLYSITGGSGVPVTGYIKYSDLGALGSVRVQVMLQTGLGISQPSLPGYLTKQ